MDTNNIDTNNIIVDAFIYHNDKYQLNIDKKDAKNVKLFFGDDIYNKYVCEKNEDQRLGYDVKLIIHKDIDEIDFGQKFIWYSNDRNNIPLLHCIDSYYFFDTLKRIETAKYDRRANIMDSSIWNYCYSNRDENKDEILNQILKSIYDNYKLGLYNLGAAYEFADLNARLCENSYLKGGHHTSKVVPFVFHSEYLSYKALGDRIEKNKTKDNKKSYTFNKKWRILLLDDHAYEKMNGRNGDYNNSANPSKLDIIVSRLKKCDDVRIITQEENGEWKGDKNDYNIAIECAKNINRLLKKLFDGNKRRYDIILLDYLLEDEYSYHIFSILKVLFDIADFDGRLDEDKINKIIDGQQKNVYDINLKDYISVEGNVLKVGKHDEHENEKDYTLEIKLDELKDRIIGGIGPDKRLYFMYISSFTQSIQERLQDQLITRSHKYWYIGKGACPTNTPEIFLYNLYELMDKRIQSLLYKTKKDSVEDFITKLFPSNDTNEIKNKCIEYFPDVLGLKAKYDNIINDVYDNNDNGSLLVQSVYNKEKYTPSFWEHFQHLCYLISYGNNSQWPEIWEEYLFIKDTLGTKVSNNIKDYVKQLSNR